MSVSRPVPVVVAAGGKGRRMGDDKPAQMLAGSSLIELALKRASLLSDVVAVAVQEMPSWGTPSGIELLYDEERDAGPLSALASALRWADAHGASHVLLFACDMPFLPADLLPLLGGGIGESAVAVAMSVGRLHPMCALWSVESLSALPDYAQNSRRSLIGFAERLGLVEVEWAVDTVDPFFNINTPDDLAVAQRLVTSGAVSI